MRKEVDALRKQLEEAAENKAALSVQGMLVQELNVFNLQLLRLLSVSV